MEFNLEFKGKIVKYNRRVIKAKRLSFRTSNQLNLHIFLRRSSTVIWTQLENFAVQFILQNCKRLAQINFKKFLCFNFKSSQLIIED